MILASKKLFATTFILLLLASALAACIKQPKPLSQEQVLDLVWSDFRPNTSSQNRSNWDNIQISLVSGREAVSEFSVVTANPCPGPILPENQAIRSSARYWFVKVVPKQASLTTTDASPTVDEVIVPEPLIAQASYLVDSVTGEIVARRIFCQKRGE